jgi:pimeloyl-ACP methyl ester carboxylesterase
MFFETYGAGRTVESAIKRGWSIAAPTHYPLDQSYDLKRLIDRLAEVTPIDRSRVYLVGHSMGASKVSTLAADHPDLYRAAALLGGGGGFNDSAKLTGKRWFVAAGDRDFGRTGSARSADSLRRGGANVVEKSYPDVEHLTVVQESLDDLFAFFDLADSER